MIWIGLLILACFAVLFFLIDWHLGTIRAQLEGLGRALLALAEGLQETNATLGSIADHTGRLPKPAEKRLPEYPGDPLGKWADD